MSPEGEELRRLVDADAQLVVETIGHSQMVATAEGVLNGLAIAWVAVFLVGVLTDAVLSGESLAAIGGAMICATCWRWFLWYAQRWVGGGPS